jgi:hypothetical protein
VLYGDPTLRFSLQSPNHAALNTRLPLGTE